MRVVCALHAAARRGTFVSDHCCKDLLDQHASGAQLCPPRCCQRYSRHLPIAPVGQVWQKCCPVLMASGRRCRATQTMGIGSGHATSSAHPEDAEEQRHEADQQQLILHVLRHLDERILLHPVEVREQEVEAQLHQQAQRDEDEQQHRATARKTVSATAATLGGSGTPTPSLPSSRARHGRTHGWTGTPRPVHKNPFRAHGATEPRCAARTG
eukprot:366390-Chlamydomonas_euryale.AAC.8